MNMKPKISSTKDFINDNFRTLAPLNYALKLIGLGCNLSSEKKPRPFVSIVINVLRALVLAVIDFFTLQYKMNNMYGEISPSVKYTDMVQMTYDFTQYIVDLHCIRKYGTVFSFEYFKKFKTIDGILGVVNYSAIRTKLLRIMVMFALLWTLTTSCDFVAWVLSYGWMESAVYSIAYIFLLIKILTILDLTSQVLHIECRLRAVGDLMQTVCDSTEEDSPLFERKNEKEFKTRESPIGTHPNTQGRMECAEIKWLSKSYLLLTGQVEFVNQMYGIRILLNSLSLLIDMVRFTNLAARIIIGSQKTKYHSGYFPVVSTVMRLMTCATVLGSLTWHCEQVYKQRDRILAIIDQLLVYKNPDEDVKTAVNDFRNLVQARPINFNMAKFFRVDYSLLVSITSVVATYSIILLQSIN